MRRATLATLLLVRATVAEAFLPRASTFGRVVAVRGSAEDDDALLQSAGWPGVKDILNQLPTFCVANAEGQPLQYEADGKPLAMFYTCVDAAKAELADAKKEYPDLDLDIIPMGLGEAFRLARSGAAVLVPSARSLLAAGAPPTATAWSKTMRVRASVTSARTSTSAPRATSTGLKRSLSTSATTTMTPESCSAASPAGPPRNVDRVRSKARKHASRLRLPSL